MLFPYQRIWFFAILLSTVDALALEPLAVLQEECFRCHNAEKRKGGLIMTSREALMKGGDSDAALIPGSREQSYLYELLDEGADPRMPPKKQLSLEVIDAIGRWIDEGAKWDASVLKSKWELPSEVRIGALPESYRPVLDLAVSPDERWLAAARGDKIEVFELSSKYPKRRVVLEGHGDAVQSLAWSADGRALVSGGFRRILVWDTSNWEAVATLQDELRGRVTSLAFLGGILVSADSLPGLPGSLRVWNLTDWTLQESFEAHEDSIFDIAVSPDQTRIATV
ncbi:MAG: c-type cytochrome domain-containing protein, partial [Verrucomicrobiota bacterium]